MEALKLVGIFAVMVGILYWRKPLPAAIAGGIVASCLLFGLGFTQSLEIIAGALTSWSTLSILLIFYLIMFLQRMLEKRDCLAQAKNALDSLSGNRRVNTMLAPMFIGLLPSAAAVLICGAIVNSYCEDHLPTEQRTVITSYFRHIPESFVPTYPSIIIGVQLSEVSIHSFLLLMVPVVFALIVLGYIFFLRKLPRETGVERGGDKRAALVTLLKNLWTLAAIVIAVIAFKVPVYIAVGATALLYVFVGRFSLAELRPMIVSSFETRLLAATALIMVLKDVIGATSVIEALPAMFAGLPVPTFLIFFLIFFCGTLVSGQQAMTAIGVPLAFAAMPNGGASLLMLLLSAGYIAMQLSPTHVCLAIVTEYFHTGMNDLIKRTLPLALVFCLFVLAYYILLQALGGFFAS